MAQISDSKRPIFRLEKELEGTFQLDGLPDTESDTSRCAAASVVAAVAVHGPERVHALAAAVAKRMERIRDDLRTAQKELASGASPSQYGLVVEEQLYRQRMLREVTRDNLFEDFGMSAVKPSFGDVPTKPYIATTWDRPPLLYAVPKSGAPKLWDFSKGEAPATPDQCRRYFTLPDGFTQEQIEKVQLPSFEYPSFYWVSTVDGETRSRWSQVPVQEETGVICVAAQLAGKYDVLVARVADNADRAYERVEQFRRNLPPIPTTEDLQRLQDHLFRAVMMDGGGLNHSEIADALQLAGFQVELPSQDEEVRRPLISFEKLLSTLEPGRMSLMGGPGHITLMGRSSRGGDVFVYDSGGVKNTEGKAFEWVDLEQIQSPKLPDLYDSTRELFPIPWK